MLQSHSAFPPRIVLGMICSRLNFSTGLVTLKPQALHQKYTSMKIGKDTDFPQHKVTMGGEKEHRILRKKSGSKGSFGVGVFCTFVTAF